MAGEGGCLALPCGPTLCFKYEARGHNRLVMTNQCGCDKGIFYSRERDSKNVFKQAIPFKGRTTFHNSICATHACSEGDNGSGVCCLVPLMCRISSGTVRTAWAERYVATANK